MSVSLDDFATLGNKLFAVSSATGLSGWYYADIPNNLDAPTWIQFTTPDTEGKLRVAGNMAYQVVDGGDVFWVDALLCNSASVTDVNPFAIYIDPRDNLVKVKEWTNTFPNDVDGTADSMPRAGRCVMWGDFLVLGDIVWKADPDQPFSDSNKSRYSHGLWFSIPGKTDTWDPVDTVFTGQKAGGNVVQGLFPLEPGLLIVTSALVALLQGSPDDFIYRELRSGISNCGRNGVSTWPSKGGVVWADQNDYVWFTNGESFQRLDEAIDINDARSVAATDEYLFVSSPSDTHVFRLYAEGGGWTRLTGTSGFLKMQATPRFLFGLEAIDSGGDFILDSPTNGILDQNLLWIQSRTMTAFDLTSDERGTFNGRKLRSIIRTRPLPGAGHEVRFWHRYGIRAKGLGSVVKGIARPSADESERGYEQRISGNLNRRNNYILDAHGPSFEATFDVEFDGDVTVEHMTVWEHGGKLER